MRIRRSLPSSLPFALTATASLLASLAACGGGSRFETALAVPTSPRQPDGVLVEPPPVLPRGEDRGNATASVVSLRPPISDDQVTTLVKGWVHALEDASTEEMMELFTSDAVLLTVGQRETVRNYYTQKFQSQGRGSQSMFSRLLRGLDLAQLDKLERYDWDDLTKNSDPPRPVEMRDGDLYVRVPLVAPLGPNGDRLVGDVLVLMLRRDADAKQVKIAGVVELNNN